MFCNVRRMGERSDIAKVSVLQIINSTCNQVLNSIVNRFSLALSFVSSYVKAAANTRLVGKQLAFLLKGLQKNNGLNFTRVHIVGFSLGGYLFWRAKTIFDAYRERFKHDFGVCLLLSATAI
jgi:hypothetical protein